MHSGVLRVVALAAIGLPSALSAQDEGPSLEALIREAEAANPQILAARRTAEAMAARVPRAGALPDPMVGLSLMNVPARHPSLGRDMMTMATVQVSERFPYPGKLRLREETAALLAEADEWEAERVRQGVIERVQRAYYEVYFVDRALAVTAANEALLADFATLTATRYGVGAGAQPDVLRAQAERTGLTDQLVALRERRTSAVARLNALLDRPSDAPLPSTEASRHGAQRRPGAER